MASEALKAAAWMIGSVVSLSAMAVAGRNVSAELDTFEIMLYRSLIGVLLVAGYAVATGRLGRITRRRLGIHLIRTLSHFAGQNLWFYALTVAPLAQVFALEFTMPLWAMLMAIFILGERLTRRRLGVALAGFVGILIITRPWATGLGPGVLPAATAAIGFAGSAILTRLLTRSETVVSVLFWLTAMQAGFALALAGIDLDIAVPSRSLLPALGVIGAAGVIAHSCLTKALSLAPATVVLPVDFSRLPLIAVVGFLIYAEPIEPAVLAGAALIFAANYVNLWIETRRPERVAAASPARLEST
jgi:drug/metabolite transporter (DMT)-like permease